MSEHILIMCSYNNGYINRAGLAGLLLVRLAQCAQLFKPIACSMSCLYVSWLYSRLMSCPGMDRKPVKALMELYCSTTLTFLGVLHWEAETTSSPANVMCAEIL